MASFFTSFIKPAVKYFILFLLGLYLLIWAISSPVIKYFAKQPLADLGLTLSDESTVRFNPFLTQLTVQKLTLKHKETIVFSLDDLSVKIALHQLLFNKMVVQDFSLSEGYLLIEKHDEQLSVAGVNLPVSNTTTDDSSANKEGVQTDNPLLNYQALISKIQLNNFNITFVNSANDQTTEHALVVKKLVISDVVANMEEQQAKLSLITLLDNAPLNINADTNIKNNVIQVMSNIALKEYDLAQLKNYAKPLTQLNGLFSLSSAQKITIKDDSVTIALTDTEINNNNIDINYQQQHLTLSAFQPIFPSINIVMEQGELTQLSGSGELTLTDANVEQGEHNEKLLAFSDLALNGIHFNAIQQPNVDVDAFIVNNIFASRAITTNNTVATKAENTTENTTEKETLLPPLLSIKQVTVSNIRASKTDIAINTIQLDTLKSDVIISKDKAIATLVTFANNQAPIEAVSPAVDDSTSSSKTLNNEKAKTAPRAAPLRISINEFSLQNGGNIEIKDNSVEPIYQRTFFVDTLTLGALSNSPKNKNNETPFALIGRSDKYTTFDFQGIVQPFSEQAHYQVKGFLKELSLPAISTYLKQVSQVELKSGQLNTEVNLNLLGDKLDGNILILLRGLETATVNNDEVNSVLDKGDLPLNMALGILKDNNDNVKLDVPIAGSTSDPKFGLSSIVSIITQKVVLMATQEYLMKTFVPYANIVSVAMSVGDFALKLRFEDLPYQAKQIKPQEAQFPFLTQFIKLMKDKKGTQIKMCAISTPADIGLPLGVSVTDKEDIKRLKAIATEREHAFKEYVIKQGEIESSRLLLCAPQIDSSKGAIPRIALSV